MYSKNHFQVNTKNFSMIHVAVFFIATMSFTNYSSFSYAQTQNAAAEETWFQVKPLRCVILHQGQACYQKLNLSWNISGDQRYCLYNATHAIEIICWQGKETSSHSMEFESDIDIIYQIRIAGEETVLLEQTVEVAWVYESKRSNSSRWRLF